MQYWDWKSVFDLIAEQSWALKAKLGMQYWDWKSVFDLIAEQSWALKAERGSIVPLSSWLDLDVLSFMTLSTLQFNNVDHVHFGFLF